MSFDPRVPIIVRVLATLLPKRPRPITANCFISNTAQNVDVLIPPPVETGETPINISIINKNWVALLIPAISIVVKPAVVGVTD